MMTRPSKQIALRYNRISLSTLIILLALTLSATHARAASSYNFARESGTYEELQNATSVPIPYGDSVYQLDLHGQMFTFFHKAYTITGTSSLEIGGDGFLRIWDDSTVMVIDGYFNALRGVDAGSSISYVLEGGAGEHVLKVQWKRAGFVNGDSADYANFQIWVYQQTGVIEWHMGASSIASFDALADGPWVGSFISPNDFSAMTEKIWITGDPAKPVIDKFKNFTFKRITSAPEPGTIYRLTPTAASGVDRRTGSVEKLWISGMFDRGLWDSPSPSHALTPNL